MPLLDITAILVCFLKVTTGKKTLNIRNFPSASVYIVSPEFPTEWDPQIFVPCHHCYRVGNIYSVAATQVTAHRAIVAEGVLRK